ncbi:MAG: M48 family metalloprotease [Gammaproteobacteria bacterium]|nr:M48 family metalloprotease [Gammaproteobacteria bacterium]
MDRSRQPFAAILSSPPFAAPRGPRSTAATIGASSADVCASPRAPRAMIPAVLLPARHGASLRTPRPWASRAARLLAALALALGLTACGVNPVTGKKEIQFVSEAAELQIGANQYAPTRQSEGGDYETIPDLTAYVSEVGQKLAAVSDRPLPYEFTVLNSSVPNAWALPGGKIAVNRGLLTALENEAELAAVLGHEIVHAAARHGAKAQERGTLLQVGMVAAQVGVAMSDMDQNLGGLLAAGAGVGAQLINTRYGRDAERESDHYGMEYMRRAGYDPSAAVTLQEKFVALAQKSGGGSGRGGWLEGLFASHPPSEERVANNRARLAELGTPGGDLGKERYATRLAPLRKIAPAYDKADEAVALARKKDLKGAKALAAEAEKQVPNEARFALLRGDLELADQQPQAALPHYERALKLDDDYFAAWLGSGTAYYRLGNRSEAAQRLERSAKLLPTAPALYYLGNIAKESGNVERALELYKGAAGSQSELGKAAAIEYASIDVQRNPGNYVASAPQLDARGTLVAVVENRAPVALEGLALSAVLLDANGSIVQQGPPVRIGRALQPGERIAVEAGVGQVAPELVGRVRFRIDGARPVQAR